MLNEKGWMATRCRLSVIEMKGWDRRMVWDDTGLRWVRTSPNIPRSTSPAYYVATGIVGSLAGMETGVGSAEPFEICAAPWLDAGEFTSYVRSLRINGVAAAPFSEGSFRGCRLRIDPRNAGNLTGLATGLLAEVNRRAGRPNLFDRSSKDKLDIFFKVYGSRSIRDQLDSGTPLPRLVQSWESTVNRFETARGPYLLY